VTGGTEPPDEVLASRAAGGDARAFSLLVTRRKDGLFRLARRYVGNSDDAYDIVQQSFVAAWRALGRYDPTRRFDTWLRAIALNKCRDHSRRAAVRRLLMLYQGEAADPVREAEARWLADQELAALDMAIAKLPRALKEPLLLTAFEELSHAEAGLALGISAKAVETRVYRARRMLAAELARNSVEKDRE
jgi:RNA polymerase sigma-70 factor (ECF subfamily)